VNIEELPEEEKNFQKNYVKAPSFLSIHLGVKASVLPAGTDCHHFLLEVNTRFYTIGYAIVES
jgi:prolycopene isomerase